jgi:hypothetical protein
VPNIEAQAGAGDGRGELFADLGLELRCIEFLRLGWPVRIGAPWGRVLQREIGEIDDPDLKRREQKQDEGKRDERELERRGADGSRQKRPRPCR